MNSRDHQMHQSVNLSFRYAPEGVILFGLGGLQDRRRPCVRMEPLYFGVQIRRELPIFSLCTSATPSKSDKSRYLNHEVFIHTEAERWVAVSCVPPLSMHTKAWPTFCRHFLFRSRRASSSHTQRQSS